MISTLSKIFNVITFLLVAMFATVASGIGPSMSQDVSFEQYMDEMIAQTLIKTSSTTEFRTFPIENSELEHLRKKHKDNINCMALNIYHEAKNQSITGQIAVGLVVINRVRDGRFPNTVCEVIMQGPVRESWKTRENPDLPDSERIYYPKRHKCQFSWYCDGKDDTPKEPTAWELATHIAEKLLFSRSYAGMLDGATHYHANYVKPAWRLDMTRISKVDDHIFYRWD